MGSTARSTARNARKKHSLGLIVEAYIAYRRANNSMARTNAYRKFHKHVSNAGMSLTESERYAKKIYSEFRHLMTRNVRGW